MQQLSIFDFGDEKPVEKKGNVTVKKLENFPEEKLFPEDKTDVPPVKKRGRKSFQELDEAAAFVHIPPDEELFSKQYYPIREVAEWFHVNPSLLRFWDNKFKILQPKKNKKGDRFFRPEDVKNLQLIYYLLRQKKLTIEGANKHLSAHKENAEADLQVVHSLNNLKNFLLELKANLTLIP